MSRRRIFLFAALIVAALLLAFLLQNAIQKVIIGPLLYVGWGLGVIYRSLPQFWVWVVLLAVIFFMLLSPFLDDRPRMRRRRKKEELERGPIETLAETLNQLNKGIYFKWVVANRLGKIVRDWLAYRERLDKRWQANALESNGWQAPTDVHKYLDVGLNGSFADYPRPRIPFIKRRTATPLDIDPNRVLDVLESNMEAESGQ